uniref:Uncharacterized protein n=1 Tax=Aegilops tauschii subsp. strangulata TaxID=200361 RepID=A0A453NUN9_AEGTS
QRPWLSSDPVHHHLALLSPRARRQRQRASHSHPTHLFLLGPLLRILHRGELRSFSRCFWRTRGFFPAMSRIGDLMPRERSVNSTSHSRKADGDSANVSGTPHDTAKHCHDEELGNIGNML